MSTIPPSPRSHRSISSNSFSDDGQDPESALILVNEHDEHDDPEAVSFELSSDEEEREEEELDQSGRSSVASLSPPTVFVYLLSPLLKLGALLSIFDVSELPLKLAVPGVLFFAGLCAFARQIWYMLSRYVRRTDLEEVFLETFAKGRSKEDRRYAIRMLIRLCTASLRVLLVAVYLRCTSRFARLSARNSYAYSLCRCGGSLYSGKVVDVTSYRRHDRAGPVYNTLIIRPLTRLRSYTLLDVVICCNIYRLVCMRVISPCAR